MKADVVITMAEVVSAPAAPMNMMNPAGTVPAAAREVGGIVLRMKSRHGLAMKRPNVDAVWTSNVNAFAVADRKAIVVQTNGSKKT
jgi:hypothetical protein